MKQLLLQAFNLIRQNPFLCYNQYYRNSCHYRFCYGGSDDL